MGTWINVKDHLPICDGDYLVCDMNSSIAYYTIRITTYRKGHKFWDSIWKKKVTHWMNLPELPRPEFINHIHDKGE